MVFIEVMRSFKYVKYNIKWGPLWAELLVVYSYDEITFGANSCA